MSEPVLTPGAARLAHRALELFDQLDRTGRIDSDTDNREPQESRHHQTD